MSGRKKSAKGKKSNRLSIENLVSKIKAITASKGTEKLSPNQRLEKAGIPSCLLLFSGDPLRSRRLIEWLEKELFENSSYEKLGFRGGDCNNKAGLQEVQASLKNFSLFSSASFIVINETEQIKAASADGLAPSILQRSPAAFVVLVCDKEKASPPMISRLDGKALEVEISELNPSQLGAWIKREAGRLTQGAGIEPKAISMLGNVYGADLTNLMHELEKLSLLSEHGKPITAQLVEAISLKSPEHTSFELFQEIAHKRILQVERLTRELIGQGLHPLQLSSFLSKCYRLLLAQKEPSQSLHSELSNAWFSRKLSSSGARLSSDELRHGITTLRELDFSLKSGGLPEQEKLALALQQLTQRRRARSAAAIY